MNRVWLTDHRTTGTSEEHYEDFTEAVYYEPSEGLVNILLYRPPNPMQRSQDAVAQVLHIQTYWRPTPGRTHASETMLNSRISYCLMRGDGATTYDGGGFVRYKINENKKILRGVLEDASVQPRRTGGQGLDIFEHAVLSGRFEASHDPSRAARFIREIERQAGAYPELLPERSPAL